MNGHSIFGSCSDVPRRGLAGAFVASLLLAGCVQQPGVATGPYVGAPVQSAVPGSAQRSQGTAPAPIIAAPVQSAVPTRSDAANTAMRSGPVDARTGLQQAALVSISGSADSRYTVLLRPDRANPGQVDAAPARLCGQDGRGVASSRTNSPGSGSAMPGVQIMIVECSA